MKTYLIETEHITCIVKAKSKLEAAIIVEKEYNCSSFNLKYVILLPEEGVVFKVRNLSGRMQVLWSEVV